MKTTGIGIKYLYFISLSLKMTQKINKIQKHILQREIPFKCFYDGNSIFPIQNKNAVYCFQISFFVPEIFKRSGKKQTIANDNFNENNDTFETKFTRHVSVNQRPSSV